MKCTPYALSLTSRTAKPLSAGGKGAYEAAVDGKNADRTADCISGPGVLAINPAAPEQDMLAASLALPSIESLLAFCGWDRADWLPVRKVVASWQWRGSQKLTFALVHHEWYDDVSERGALPSTPLWVSPDTNAPLRSVPEGLAASGTLKVLGEWVPATLVSSRVDETFRLTAVLPGRCADFDCDQMRQKCQADQRAVAYFDVLSHLTLGRLCSPGMAGDASHRCGACWRLLAKCRADGQAWREARRRCR